MGTPGIHTTHAVSTLAKIPGAVPRSLRSNLSPIWGPKPGAITLRNLHPGAHTPVKSFDLLPGTGRMLKGLPHGCRHGVARTIIEGGAKAPGYQYEVQPSAAAA